MNLQQQLESANSGDSARLVVTEWEHVEPRARIVVSRSDDDLVVGALDVGVFDFEVKGLLVSRLAHLLEPMLAKTERNDLVSVGLDIEASETFLTALRHRLDAEPGLAGAGISGLRLPPSTRSLLVQEKPDLRIVGHCRTRADGSLEAELEILGGEDRPEKVALVGRSEIEVVEAFAEKFLAHAGIESAWDRNTEIESLRVEARWALQHGLAIEAACGADRLWALGDHDRKTNALRLHAHSLAATLLWRDLYSHGPRGTSRGGSNIGNFPGQTIDPEASPLHLAYAISAVECVTESMADLAPRDEVSPPPFLEDPFVLASQVLLNSSRVLRSCRFQGRSDAESRPLRLALAKAYEATLEKVDRGDGAAFFGQVAAAGIPWWYPDHEERFQAFRAYFAEAPAPAKRYRKQGLQESFSSGLGDGSSPRLFPARHDLDPPPGMMASVFPYVPQMENGWVGKSEVYDWLVALVRKTDPEHDWTTRATAWCLLAAVCRYNLEGRGSLREEPHALVLEAIEELGFLPSYKKWVQSEARQFVLDTAGVWREFEELPTSLGFLCQLAVVGPGEMVRQFNLTPPTLATPGQIEKLFTHDILPSPEERLLLDEWQEKLPAHFPGYPEATYWRRSTKAPEAEEKVEPEKPKPDFSEAAEAEPLKSILWIYEDVASQGDHLPAEAWEGGLHSKYQIDEAGRVWYLVRGKGLLCITPAKETFESEWHPLPPELLEHIVAGGTASPSYWQWSLDQGRVVLCTRGATVHVWEIETGEWAVHELPFSLENHHGRFSARICPSPKGYLFAIDDSLEWLSCGTAAFLPLGGSVCELDLETGTTELVASSRRFPATNLLEEQGLFWPNDIASVGDHLVIDASLDQGRGGRSVVFTRDPTGLWQRGLNLTPAYPRVGSIRDAGEGRLLAHSRTRYSNVAGNELALVDPARPHEAKLLYRSSFPNDDEIRTFGLARPEWEEVGFGLKSPGYDVHGSRLVFLHARHIGVAAFETPNERRWRRIAFSPTEEQNELITKNGFSAKDPKKHLDQFKTIRATDKGALFIGFEGSLLFVPWDEED